MYAKKQLIWRSVCIRSENNDYRYGLFHKLYSVVSPFKPKKNSKKVWFYWLDIHISCFTGCITFDKGGDDNLFSDSCKYPDINR